MHSYAYDTRNRLTNLGVAKGATNLAGGATLTRETVRVAYLCGFGSAKVAFFSWVWGLKSFHEGPLTQALCYPAANTILVSSKLFGTSHLK